MTEHLSGVGEVPIYNGTQAKYESDFILTWIVCIVVVLWVIFKRK